jgi:hypothetical protein
MSIPAGDNGRLLLRQGRPQLLVRPPVGSSVFSIVGVSVDKVEGSLGAGVLTSYTFEVRRTAPSTFAGSVVYKTRGTGANDAQATDFSGDVFPTGTVVWAVGDVSPKTISVLVKSDLTVEADESFEVYLEQPVGGSINSAAGAASGIIRNDDIITVSVTPLSADKFEGDVGENPFTFTASISAPPPQRVTVNWAISTVGLINPATAGDFAGSIFPSGTLIWEAGDGSNRTITTLVVSGTNVAEPDQPFDVVLSNPTGGAVLGSASARGTIRDDDTIVIVIPDAYDFPANFTETRNYFFPFGPDPDNVGDNVYWVGGNKTGGATKDKFNPGNLQNTISSVNDGARIVMRGVHGEYGGFIETGPKAGQTGRIMIIGEFPPFAEVNAGNFNIPIIGVHEVNNAVVNGKIDIRGYRNFWAEGLRFKDRTSGQIWISDAPTGILWVVNCRGSNNTVRAFYFEDSACAVVYNCWSLCDERHRPGLAVGVQWTQDYQAAFLNIRTSYVIKNLIQGGGNQNVSTHKGTPIDMDTFVEGNLFDQSIPVARETGALTTGGQTLFLGQSVDQSGEDSTGGHAKVWRNHFRKSYGGHCICASNLVDADCYENTWVGMSSGGPTNLINCTSWASGSDDFVWGPLHPKWRRFHDNTILGRAGGYEWNEGKSWVAIPGFGPDGGTGGTKIEIYNNSVQNGSIARNHVFSNDILKGGQNFSSTIRQQVLRTGSNPGLL